MKALEIRRRTGRPTSALAHDWPEWVPPEGTNGVLLRLEIPEVEFAREVAYWEGDPHGELRMVDLWGPNIVVIGERYLPDSHPVFRRISELRARFQQPAECGE